jgi:hypothetical protein
MTAGSYGLWRHLADGALARIYARYGIELQRPQ